MKKLIIPIALATLAFSGAYAQNHEGVKKEGAHEAEYNADAQDRNHSGEIDSRVNNKDTTSDQSSTANQDNTERFNDQATAPSSPWGDSRTVSSSGSPGVLAKDQDVTDGTNTIQQAQPNIAGSPVPGGKNTRSKQTGPQNDERSENRRFRMENQKSVPNNAQRKASETETDDAKASASSNNRERKIQKKSK
jgi:hypothetical protein